MSTSALNRGKRQGGGELRYAGSSNRATISVVAEDAGVSVATVSKVVNGRTGVSRETRERVQEAVHRLGYVSFGERQSGIADTREATIELVVSPPDVSNPYLSTFLGGALQAATRLNAALLLRDVATIREQDPLEWAQSVARSGRMGIIEVTSEYSRRREKALRTVGLPMVLVDPIDVPRTETPSVGATNWAGAYSATKHLLELGHTKIRYIGGPPGAACDIVRAHGWAAAMAEAGIAVKLDDIPRAGFTFRHGLAAATALLTSDDRPTAIFAGSDISATGVLEAARRLGLQVPGDLSVVGFDDTVLAHTSAPPLTTVHQPIAEIGAAAVSILLRLSRGEIIPAKRVELATELVVRSSTGAPHDSESDHN
jgi:LacI family transcriptional regulator